MKKALLGWLIVLLVLSMTACSFFTPVEDKDFAFEDMTITLDDSFEVYKAQSKDAAYVSDKHGYAISVTKKDFFLFEDEEAPIPASVEDFAASQNPNATIDIKKQDSVTYYTYEQEVEGRDFTYLVALYASLDAYWMIEFACESGKFDKAQPDFISFAQTVMFEASESLSLL